MPTMGRMGQLDRSTKNPAQNPNRASWINGGGGQDRPPHTRRTPDRRVSGELFQMESGEGEDRTHDTWFFRPVLYH